MLCVLCLIVLWGFSLVTSYSGVIDQHALPKYGTDALMLVDAVVGALIRSAIARGLMLYRVRWKLSAAESIVEEMNG